MAKVRLDTLVYEQGLALSLERARSLIMMGRVLVDRQKSDKPGTQVSDQATLQLIGEEPPFVSRGGIKLLGALQSFGIDVTGMCGLDIGASTGGFTDCLLKRGAARVYAVDVGTHQLAYALQKDPRVINLEQTHIDALTETLMPELADITVIDVSFISLTRVIPKALKFLKCPGHLIALIKPQFEAERSEVEAGGIVRDLAVHAAVQSKIRTLCEAQGLQVQEIIPSSITGAKKGNQEYLLWARRA